MSNFPARNGAKHVEWVQIVPWHWYNVGGKSISEMRNFTAESLVSIVTIHTAPLRVRIQALAGSSTMKWK